MWRVVLISAALAWGICDPGMLSKPIADDPLTGWAVADLRLLSAAEVEQLKHSDGIDAWVEVGDWMLLSIDRADTATELPIPTVPIAVASSESLAFLRKGTGMDQLPPHRELVVSGPYAVIAFSGPVDLTAFQSSDSRAPDRFRLTPFQPDTVLVHRVRPDEVAVSKTAVRSATQDLVDAVDGTRWYAEISTLASYNRYTHSTGANSIADARDYLVSQFEALPGLSVTTQAFTVGSTQTHNVIATLSGSTRPDDWILIGAHYDSTSESPSTSAPGAEDNASGTAGVLELARVFAGDPPDATLIFLCFSGEEQGLHGSSFHAQSLVDGGLQDQVVAMVNMDMIGYTGDAELDCLLETDVPLGLDLRNAMAQAAAQYTTLAIYTSNYASGSDHVPYLNRDMPAVLAIENDWNSYPHYHRTTDLPEHITISMGEETLKMNVATVAEMAYDKATLLADSVTLLNPGTNGVADPGETLQLNLPVENSGNRAATAVQGTLSSLDPLVTVSQPQSAYPDIPAGESRDNSTPFVITIDPSLSCGASFDLRLDLTYSDGSRATLAAVVTLGTGIVIGADASTSPGLAIPDNDPTGVESTLTERRNGK